MTPEQIDRLVKASDCAMAAKRRLLAAQNACREAATVLNLAERAFDVAEADLFVVLTEIHGATNVPV